MEPFLATLIFLLPGVLAYFWVQKFGVNPPTPHKGMNLTVIATLLWVPTTILTIVIYDVIALVAKLTVLSSFKALITATDSFVFVLGFVVLSTGSSFVVAYVWVVYGYQATNKLVNKVRAKRNLAKLDELTTVWENFFLSNEQQLVEVYKLGESEPEKRIYGGLKKGSRPYEIDKALVLVDVEDWTGEMKKRKYSVKRSYVNLNSGIVVNELDFENPEPQIKLDSKSE